MGVTVEDCQWTTWVYGLSYPHRGIFYIGVSVSPWMRLQQHWAADGTCTSHSVIRQWKRFGEKPDLVLFGEHQSRVEAMRTERALIHYLPDLVNCTAGQGVLSYRRYPVNESDAILLQDALETAGLLAIDANIDRSDEYVDERYDELDLIEPP